MPSLNKSSGSPNSSAGKESTCNEGVTQEVGSIPELGRYPVGRSGNPLQYSCLKKSHKHRGLIGYSPKGCKESNTTGQLNTHAVNKSSTPTT